MQVRESCQTGGQGRMFHQKLFWQIGKKKKKRRPKGPLGILLNILSIQNRKSTCNWCQAQDKINKKKKSPSKDLQLEIFPEWSHWESRKWLDQFSGKGNMGLSSILKDKKKLQGKKNEPNPDASCQRCWDFFHSWLGPFDICVENVTGVQQDLRWGNRSKNWHKMMLVAFKLVPTLVQGQSL